MCRKAALIFGSHADCPGPLVTIGSNHHFWEVFGNRGDRPDFNWFCFSPATVQLAPLCQSERQSVVDRSPVNNQPQPIWTLEKNSKQHQQPTSNKCDQQCEPKHICGRALSFSWWRGIFLVWSDVAPGFGAASPSHNSKQLL